MESCWKNTWHFWRRGLSSLMTGAKLLFFSAIVFVNWTTYHQKQWDYEFLMYKHLKLKQLEIQMRYKNKEIASTIWEMSSKVLPFSSSSSLFNVEIFSSSSCVWWKPLIPCFPSIFACEMQILKINFAFDYQVNRVWNTFEDTRKGVHMQYEVMN